MLPGGIPIPLQSAIDAADQAGTYTNFAGLAALRAQAQRDAAGTLEAVAGQFESLFVNMMLKSMRDTTSGDSLLGSGGQMFTELFDQQISLDIAKTRRFGLAEVMIRQLSSIVPQTSATPASSASPGLKPLPPALQSVPVVRTRDVKPEPPPQEIVSTTPAAFVKSLWRHAQDAAQSMGLNPKVLIAQAALETGWGRSVIQDGSGRSSNNLFGIKADGRWRGEKVEVPTLEYTEGLLTKVRAPFRSYHSMAESFSDYVDFIRNQPRYSDAVANASNPEKYLQALQSAGYATDPNYAAKILSIYQRKELSEFVDSAVASEAEHGF